MSSDSIEHQTLQYAQIAHDAFRDIASFFRSLPDDAWDGPTGCELWTQHDLAGHIVGEAVYFARLTRGVTEDRPRYPDELWSQLKKLPGMVIADTIGGAGTDLLDAVRAARPQDLGESVDLGWIRWPLWRGLYVGMFEAVFHNWDAHVGRDPAAVIPSEWAVPLAGGLLPMAQALADAVAAEENAGVYVLHVGDGVGPVIVDARLDGVEIKEGNAGRAEVKLELTPDQYARLIAGRLPLAAAIDEGAVKVEGDAQRAVALNAIFPGVGG